MEITEIALGEEQQMSLNTLPTLTEGSTPYQVPLLLSRDRQTHFIFSDRGTKLTCPGLGGRDQERVI